MQLQALLSAADPARRAQVDQADSGGAAALYRRIVGTPRAGEGGGAPAPVPGETHLRTHSQGRTPRVSARLTVTAGVALAVAIAVTIGLVAIAGGSPTRHRTLADGPRQPRPAPVSPPSQAPPPASPPPAPPNQAAPELDALATVAAGRPSTSLVPGPGQYLYVLDIEVKGAPPGGGPGMPCGSVIRQQWLASDGSGQQTGDSPGCGSNETQFTQSWGTSGNGINFDYLGWQGLPTQPAAMEAAIVDRFEDGQASNAMTFLLATGVLNFTAPPAVRSALFRMLATLPGVQYLGQMTDPLGRTGDTIALIQQGLGDLVAVFAPQTSQVLDQASTLTSGPLQLPSQMWPTFEPEMYLETGVVSSVTATPPGTATLLSQLPYQQWVG